MTNNASFVLPHTHTNTQDQYRFIYEALEEAHVCGKTYFPACELAHQIKQKSHKNVLLLQNEYQLEYKVIEHLNHLNNHLQFSTSLCQKIQKMTRKPTIGECAGGHRVENREKNRDVSIVPRKLFFFFLCLSLANSDALFSSPFTPADNFRPYLTSFQSNEHTDYINAVFVDV